MKEGWNPRLSMYVSNRPALVEYASRMLGSREAAEDVVQEAFINFMPSKGASTPHRPQAYLFRIVHNLVVDILRRKKLEAKTLSKCATVLEWVAPEPQPTPEEAFLFCEDVRRSMDILAKLPENQRIALEMMRFGGQPAEAVSERLGVSVPTVYRLVQSAVATITIGLKHETADPNSSPRRK